MSLPRDLREFKQDKKKAEISGPLKVVVNHSKETHNLAHCTLYPEQYVVLPEKEAETLLEDFPQVFKEMSNASDIIRQLNKKHDNDRSKYVRKARFVDEFENDPEDSIE